MLLSIFDGAERERICHACERSHGLIWERIENCSVVIAARGNVASSVKMEVPVWGDSDLAVLRLHFGTELVNVDGELLSSACGAISSVEMGLRVS